MRPFVFECAFTFSISRERLFAYYESSNAFFRLLPPWEKIESIEKGFRTDHLHLYFRQKFGPFTFHWKVLQKSFSRSDVFQSEMVSGPFKSFKHEHHFIKVDEETTVLKDRIEYFLKGGALVNFLLSPFISRRLRKIFCNRKRVIEEDLRHISVYKKKKVLLSGVHGFLGKTLSYFLSVAGYDVFALVRSFPKSAKEIFWDYRKGIISLDELEGFDAVIHLAGENISSSFWTKKQKRKIYESRVNSTKFLVQSLNKLQKRPEVVIAASAVGYYGDQKDVTLSEYSSKGEGFLSDVVAEWEKVLQEFKGRSVSARFGVIIGSKGGMLAKLLTPFKLGLGMVIGDGTNALAWISVDDAVYSLHHILEHADLSGPVNVVSPSTLTEQGMMEQVARHLHRPLWIRVPKKIIQLLLGEMSRLFLDSQKVEPKKLLDSGMIFSYPNFEDTLKQQLPNGSF